MRLLGPHTLDLLAPDRAARELLARLAAGPGGLDEASGAEPGLYLLLDDADALRGFWVTVPATWLEDGAGSGRTPPIAKALLDAATEEVWWERFRVAPLHLEAWRPVVVFEWPPELASRCGLPPPGVPELRAERAEARELDAWQGAGWLEPVDVTEDAPRLPGGDDAGDPWPELPEARSLVTLVRGSLRRGRSVHEGRFELVALPDPSEDSDETLGLASIPAAWRRGLPLDEWVPNAATGVVVVPREHELGWPLRLPGERVGFPLSGWLDRDLDVQPATPGEAQPGVLVPRDTRSRLFGQIVLALSVTAWVLLGTIGFSGGLHWLSQPVTEATAAPIALAPQPAISVCSADHRRFVEHLRCQVAHLSGGGQPGLARCGGDRGEDLQAAWCGLRDRDLDGDFSPSGHAWADTAASQACFDVLGKPYSYALQETGGQRADPVRLLDDPRLRVSALVDVVGALDAACGSYRQKLERKIAGAVLATHVGGRGDEPAALQRLVFERASTGLTESARQCFEQGRDEGAGASVGWRSLCGNQDDERAWDLSKAWTVLGGDPSDEVPQVVDRYLDARFGARAPTQDLWRCHLRLTHGAPSGADDGRWELPVPVPGTYADGGVTTQLQLDAWLLALREDGRDGGACWREIDRMLASYQPVHPLLGAVSEGGWPSSEQQVCAQVCAARYRLSRGRLDAWVTPGGDLGTCLDRSAPPLDPSRAGKSVIDRLRLPWNDDPQAGWRDPSAEDICAFNLVAQALLPGVLPEKVPPPLWAGELVSGSGIAGGRSGAAAQAAQALSGFGRNRSTATCGHAATQCLVAELLDVLGDRDLGPHEWRDAWQRRVTSIPRRTRGEDGVRPWCRLVAPFVSEDTRLPEGDLDFPCALGVEQARQRVESSVQALASASYLERVR